MDFIFNGGLNNLSFGSVSFMFLREAWKLGLQPAIFPIGPVVTEAQNIEPDFASWLNSGINKSRFASRTQPVLKIWHLNDGLSSYGKSQVLYTFFELDRGTAEEHNIVKNQEATIFSSSCAAEIFKNDGPKVTSVPLGFDKYNFMAKHRPSYPDNRIVFNLLGKFEKRKRHQKVIKSWIKKFGKDRRYFLQCSLHNHFLSPEELQQNYLQCLDNKNDIFNVKFYNFLPTNAEFNSFLCSANIVIGMSGGEGFSLGDFQSLALGAHGVILNATAYRDWATESNAVLVSPSGKIAAEDGKFFIRGAPYNDGAAMIYDWNEDDFIEGCERAIKRVQADPTNWEGMKLQTQFTTRKMAEDVLNVLKFI